MKDKKIVSRKEVVISRRVKKDDDWVYKPATLEQVIESEDRSVYLFAVKGVSIDEVKSGIVQLPDEIVELYPDEIFDLTAQVVDGKYGTYVSASFKPKGKPVSPKTKAKWLACWKE